MRTPVDLYGMKTRIAVTSVLIGSFRFNYEMFPFEGCYYKLVVVLAFGSTVVLEMCCAKEIDDNEFIVADF